MLGSVELSDSVRIGDFVRASRISRRMVEASRNGTKRMKMNGKLVGQVAIVTGGGRGIGPGIARALLEEGASVVITQRSAAELEATAVSLREHGQVSAFPCDITQRAEVEALCEYAFAEYGRLDIMVANAGGGDGGPFLDLTDDVWESTLALNLGGTFACAQEAARRMVENETRGRIVLISSICAFAAEANAAAYNVSKAGVNALCKSMAVDLAEYGIVTNAIAPGWIRSSNTVDELSPAMLSGEERFPLNPQGRIGEPEDIGRAVAWLADPSTTFVSGAVIVVDGAQTSFLPWVDDK